MNKKAFVFLAVLVLVTMACSITSLLPTKTPSGSGGSSNILYQDNFADSSSGWPNHQTSNSIMDYANGGYRIYVTSADLMAFVTSGNTFQSDVSVQVDATKVGGPDDNYIGIICRYQDQDNFYFFVFSSDGYAGIGMYQYNEMSILSGDSFGPSSKINQGDATNTVRGDCVGNTLTLYVNGSQVGSAIDSTFTSGGDAGILARANAVSGVDVLFNNFTVSKP
jgi:hypothetical protein